MSKKQNPLLSKRVNFPSVGVIVDEYSTGIQGWLKLSDEDTEKLRQVLFQMMTRFMSSAQHALTLGAQKGIDEALELMKDPEYHETVKKRRQAERERYRSSKEDSQKQQDEYIRRRDFPTREEKVFDICSAMKDMAYERQRYHRSRDLIQKFVEEEGNGIVVDAIKRSSSMPDDLWFENFDVDNWVKALSSVDIATPPPEKTPDSKPDPLDDFFDKNSEFE